MRVKRALNIKGVERIKGLTSQELADRCPDGLQVFPVSPCTNCGCEYAIGEPGYMNCTFVASEVSEHTLESIGEMMGISREGIRKIEERALRKIRVAMDKLQQTQDDNASLHEQGPAPGSDHVNADGQGFEPSNEPYGIPALNGRKLAQCRR